MEKRKYDENFKLDCFNFDGVIDEDGKLIINFQYKVCYFLIDYEVVFDLLCLDVIIFLNVLKSDRSS